MLDYSSVSSSLHVLTFDHTLSSSPANNTIESTDITRIPIYVMTLWMSVVLPALIFLLGAFGNIMTVVILSRIGSGPTNLFFMALSLSDLCLLSAGTVPYWGRKDLKNALYRQNAASCKLIVYLAYASAMLSARLLTAMSLQWSMSIIWPHRVRIMCTNNNSFYCVIRITLFAFLVQTHILYGVGVVTVFGFTECTEVTEEYRQFFSTIWSCVDLFSYSFLPFLILFASNNVLVWNLKVSVTDLRKSAVCGSNVETRKKKASSVTLTLVLVSTMYFVLTAPYCLLQVIDATSNTFEKRFYDIYYDALYIRFSNFVDFFWVSGSAVNFYLYCLTRAKFRSEFFHIVSAWQGHLYIFRRNGYP